MGPGGTVNYLFDGLSVIQETDGGGNLLKKYNPGISETDSTGTELFYSHDGLGSVVNLTDAKGNLVDKTEYEAFGSSSETKSGYLFTGATDGYTDSDVQLVYMWNRWYDEGTGRFVSPDPIMGSIYSPQSQNRYAYVKNSPLNFIDPYGLWLAVISNGQTKGNPIGHSAIAVSGYGVYSWGNDMPLGSSLTDYLKRESPRRSTYVTIIETSPEQDAQVMGYLNSENPSLPHWTSGDTCATRTNRALYAAGVSDATAIPDFLPQDVFINANIAAMLVGGHSVYIPQGGSVPPTLRIFNPQVGKQSAKLGGAGKKQ